MWPNRDQQKQKNSARFTTKSAMRGLEVISMIAWLAGEVAGGSAQAKKFVVLYLTPVRTGVNSDRCYMIEIHACLVLYCLAKFRENSGDRSPCWNRPSTH
eukprot:SAG31_NODE_917_length_11033_cov_3.285897_10_plen_100_part_00